jgi:hypothetical protein
MTYVPSMQSPVDLKIACFFEIHAMTLDAPFKRQKVTSRSIAGSRLMAMLCVALEIPNPASFIVGASNGKFGRLG